MLRGLGYLLIAVLIVLGLVEVAKIVVEEFLPRQPLRHTGFETRMYQQGPSSAADGAIVFVHGLGGGIESTWTNPSTGTSWMNLVCGDQRLKSFDVFACGYNTEIIKNEASLAAVARDLAQFVDRVCKEHGTLVVVAHSMGGLIAQQALTLSAVRNRQYQVTILVTLASPLLGSDLADFARRAEFLTSNHVEALTTMANAESLYQFLWQQLRTELPERIRHYAAYETAPIGPVRIVSKNSATYGADRAFGPDFVNHSEIAKPANRKAAVYRRVRDWILERKSEQFAAGRLPADVLCPST